MLTGHDRMILCTADVHAFRSFSVAFRGITSDREIMLAFTTMDSTNRAIVLGVAIVLVLFFALDLFFTGPKGEE